MRGRIWVVVLFLVIFLSFVSAEEGIITIKGKLVNELTNEPLTEEYIFYAGDDRINHYLNVTTDLNGNFEFEVWSENGYFFSCIMHFGEYDCRDCEKYGDIDFQVHKYEYNNGYSFWTLRQSSPLSSIIYTPLPPAEEEIEDFGEVLDLGTVYTYPFKEIKIKNSDYKSSLVFTEIKVRKDSLHEWNNTHSSNIDHIGTSYFIPTGYEMSFVAKRCSLSGGYYVDCEDNEIISDTYEILNDTLFLVDDENNIEKLDNELYIEHIYDSMDLVIEDENNKELKISIPALNVERKAEWDSYISSSNSYWVASDGSLYNAVRERLDKEESIYMNHFVQIGIEEALTLENLVWKSSYYDENVVPTPMMINNMKRAFVVKNNVESGYNLLAKFNLAGSLCNEELPIMPREDFFKFIKENLGECDNRWGDFYLEGNEFKPNRNLFLLNLFNVNNEGPLRLTLYVEDDYQGREIGEMCHNNLDCKSGLCSRYGCVESKESFLNLIDFFSRKSASDRVEKE